MKRVLVPRFSTPFLASLALVAIGVGAGIACDVKPDRPAAHRAGYRVLEADFHSHTSWSDGSLSPLGVVRQAARRGLDVIAVTEHNTVKPSQVARWYAKASDGPLAVTGEEVTSARFHLIAIGIEDTVSPERDVRSAIDEIHAQGGIAIAAHPVRGYWPSLVPERGALDGAEIMHPLVYGSSAPGWKWADMVAFRDGASAPLTAIGSSDYHWGSVLGLCRTLVFVPEPVTDRGVMDALRAHRTVTLDLEGNPIGPPDLVSALRAEPYVPRTSDWQYRGSGLVDRITRALGLLGVVGVVVFRARRRTPRA